MFSATVAILGTVATLRFEQAIPLPAKDRDANCLAVLGLVSAASATTLGSLILLVLGQSMAEFIGHPDLSGWLWLAPVAAFPLAAYQVLNALAIRKQNYGSIARRNVLQPTAAVTTQIGAGVAGLQLGGLIAGLIVGQLVGALSLILQSGSLGHLVKCAWTRTQLKSALRRYWRFPLILTPAGLLNALGAHLPVILIGLWYGGNAAGWFGLTQRVLSVPVLLVSQAVGQVYLAQIAASRRQGLGKETFIFVHTSFRLSVIGFLGAGSLLLTGPTLFEFVFGRDWTVSGSIAQPMALALSAQFVASPISQTLIVYERPAAQLIFDISRLAAIVAALTVSAVSGQSLLTTVWAYALASALAYAMIWELSRRALRR